MVVVGRELSPQRCFSQVAGGMIAPAYRCGSGRSADQAWSAVWTVVSDGLVQFLDLPAQLNHAHAPDHRHN